MKTLRFDFNYKPLRISKSITVEGGVPDRQVLDLNLGRYIPNYSITNLILQPRISAYDPDGIFRSGEANDKLTNVRWFEVIDGSRKEILDSNSEYRIIRDGLNAGKISVKKNAEPKIPITLEFQADLIDTRTREIYEINDSKLIICGTTETKVKLELNACSLTMYDPTSDNNVQSIVPRVFAGDKMLDNSEFSIFWYKSIHGGAWMRINNTIENYDFSIVGNCLTVKKNLMGEEITVRCRAVIKNTDSQRRLEKDCTFRRRMPRFDYGIIRAPYNISPDVKSIKPRAYVTTPKGILSDPSKYFAIEWKTSPNTNSKDYKLIATGTEAVVPTDFISEGDGGMLALEVYDRGADCSWSDSDGAMFIDSDGSILLIN